MDTTYLMLILIVTVVKRFSGINDFTDEERERHQHQRRDNDTPKRQCQELVLGTRQFEQAADLMLHLASGGAGLGSRWLRSQTRWQQRKPPGAKAVMAKLSWVR